MQLAAAAYLISTLWMTKRAAIHNWFADSELHPNHGPVGCRSCHGSSLGAGVVPIIRQGRMRFQLFPLPVFAGQFRREERP